MKHILVVFLLILAWIWLWVWITVIKGIDLGIIPALLSFLFGWKLLEIHDWLKRN